MSLSAEEMLASIERSWALRRAHAEPLVRDVRGRVVGALPEFRQRFGVGRVFLFGSFSRGIPSAVSDVDVAVEGLAPAEQFRAMAWLSSMVGRDVDLVRLEDLPLADAESIRASGEPL